MRFDAAMVGEREASARRARGEREASVRLVSEGLLSQVDAAREVGLTARQVRRVVRRWEASDLWRTAVRTAQRRHRRPFFLAQESGHSRWRTTAS